jgi:hypothetical protein
MCTEPVNYIAVACLDMQERTFYFKFCLFWTVHTLIAYFTFYICTSWNFACPISL